MSFSAAALMAGATLGGSYLGYLGNKAANEKNISAQREANQLSIELSNTAHQREVADLRAAGLNPILSAGGSGASVPSLGAATVESEMAPIANSATAVGKQLAELTKTATRLDNQMREKNIESGALDNQSRRIEIKQAEAQLQDYLRSFERNSIKRALVENEELQNRSSAAKLADYENERRAIAWETLSPKQEQEILAAMRQEIISGIKNRANENLRNNLHSFSSTARDLSGAISDWLPWSRNMRMMRMMKGR